MIRADLENVWSATQDPHEHVRWDVRFSHIQPSNPGGAGPTQFRYTRTVPFRVVHGVGVSLGEVTRPGGLRTSALRFSTNDRLVTDPLRTRLLALYPDARWGPFHHRVRLRARMGAAGCYRSPSCGVGDCVEFRPVENLGGRRRRTRAVAAAWGVQLLAT